MLKTAKWMLGVWALLLFAGTVQAEVKLPAALDSHMVLQRDQPLVFWGTAAAGEEVTVTLGQDSAAAKADEAGNWQVKLPAQEASATPQTVTVQGSNKIELTDVLIGDVWVGSGQSNMEWGLNATHGAQEAIAAAKHPLVRLLHVKKTQVPAPAADIVLNDAEGWKACTPETVPNFSAVLYYFGVKLQQELDIPIGLINSSWGGSPIEPWTVTDKQSGGMYNGMIAPLRNYAVKGAIWYQGETNVIQKNGLAYAGKMADLINGWRGFWGVDLPFYFVQIAPWANENYAEGQLPALWEAQTATLKLPHTGMVVTTDLVDDLKDIHPRNKLDVGHRLARWALAKTYGKEVVFSGPLYKSLKIEDGKIRLSFAHVAKGLKSLDGQPLTDFTIAGEDGQFVPAEAVIDGETVVVSAAAVTAPKQIRFGWHREATPNLGNSEGLPAGPFQTENWQGGTGE